ncbi:hypothetical protein AL542_04045 [Grimontia hollisae]|uniref:Uncharacterized protein n=1 Tax=Grimontia hollisae TaxID=673 RepID=A0A377HMU6_GRIHO|nr:hypothetical protein [Grimontia hollisae]AMG29645.1 hypothetical protein AL542_04045 [Grimontia hollisae]MDF2186583.1 hypothetical protein [Grimontia hollisae]STO43730.1 Uncharacterised protein [Grimontia hollisae]STO57065.1 Uncharacterised protein [Grimontia hollisae]STQ74927.1 Uncharacterised protein [Grimontia hollisae]
MLPIVNVRLMQGYASESVCDTTISKIKSMKEEIESAVSKHTICDAKAQEILRTIRKNNILWSECKDKLKVRVIKSLDGCLSLHPKDEDEERWSGKYHVYITIENEGEELAIDPYIGGDDSCASLSEKKWIEHNWRGEEGKDYILETIAPKEEFYDNKDNYEPAFRLEDFMYNSFDPDTYASHAYYYQCD